MAPLRAIGSSQYPLAMAQQPPPPLPGGTPPPGGPGDHSPFHEPTRRKGWVVAFHPRRKAIGVAALSLLLIAVAVTVVLRVTSRETFPFEDRDPTSLVKRLPEHGVRVCADNPNYVPRYKLSGRGEQTFAETWDFALTLPDGRCFVEIARMEATPSHSYIDFNRYESVTKRDAGLSAILTDAKTKGPPVYLHVWTYGRFVVTLSSSTTRDVERPVLAALACVAGVHEAWRSSSALSPPARCEPGDSSSAAPAPQGPSAAVAATCAAFERASEAWRQAESELSARRARGELVDDRSGERAFAQEVEGIARASQTGTRLESVLLQIAREFSTGEEEDPENASLRTNICAGFDT